MPNYKTIALTGAETEVKISGQNCDIRNDGADTVYAGGKPGLVAGADGVASIPAGQAVKLLDTGGTVYLLGTGSVLLCGNDYAESVFKTAASASGGGGTEDTIARTAINTHAGNGEIHLTADEVIEAAATAISNPNLLINSWFGNGVINQREQTEYTGQDTGPYTIDSWKLYSGNATVIVNDDTLTFKNDSAEWSELRQIIENAERFDGKYLAVSASIDGVVYSGVSDVPFDSTQDYTPVLVNGTDFSVSVRNIPSTQGLFVRIGTNVAMSINVDWIKLELGSVATPFTPPDPATELEKCQRYYEKISLFANPYGTLSNSIIAQGFFKAEKRVIPTLTVVSANGTDIDAMGEVGNTTTKIPIRILCDNSIFYAEYTGDTTPCEHNGTVGCTIYASAEI